MASLAIDDAEVARLIRDERLRVENSIDLAAGLSHAPPAVVRARGAVVAIEAAEGWAGGKGHAEAAGLERLAASRCRRLFGAEHVNVQPHSGVAANLAAYFGALDVGDRVLSLRPSHGGDQTHGGLSSLAGRCFSFAHYGLDPRTERIDYDRLWELAREFRPRMIVAGAGAYPRAIDYAQMAAIAEESSAYLLVDMAPIAGLVAAGVLPSPVPHSDFVTLSTRQTLLGGKGGVILCRRRFGGQVDRAIAPGSQGAPSMSQLAAKAVCFKLASEAAFAGLQKMSAENAACIAAAFAARGYRPVTGGTDNHLVLLDLRPRQLTGDAAATALASVGIVVEAHAVPYDASGPCAAGGLRIASTAMTARGMGTAEALGIVDLVDRVLSSPGDRTAAASAAGAVADLCRRFPACPEISAAG